MTTACARLKVLDFSWGMAGPLATMILADNGAEVVKVERPEGDWARGQPGFLMWNRGKQSVVLDLTREEDRAMAERLARWADVVVESFRPGVADRLGIGYAALAAANPRLIYCSISGFGQCGPLSRIQGYEGTVLSKAGRMIGLDHITGAIAGQDRAAPIYTASPVASYAAAQLAVQGIASALLARKKTGRGQRVQTSLLQAATCFITRGLARGEGGEAIDATVPTIRAGVELCFLAAQCQDGKWIQMCARQDHHFRNWLAALGLSEVLQDPVYAKAPLGIQRLEDIKALEGRIRERMRQKTQAEWMRCFIEEYDVGADPFLTPEEFMAHPQMVLNGRIVEIDDRTVGRTTQVGPLVIFSRTPSRIGQPAPRLGQHTQSVRARLSSGGAGPASSAALTAIRKPHPLSGITILEVAYFLAGPFSATMLAEMGARVIKVEPLEGDPYRRTGLGFVKMVHGKESIAIDLKRAAGVRILHQLVERSDALIHSFRPGVPERLGLDYPTLEAINPRLVYLYAGSCGSEGPQSHRAAFHSTPHALVGGGFLQAGQGNPPADDAYPDPGSGLGAGTALMLGLLAREQTGVGQYLETTMLCSTAYLHSDSLVLYEGMTPRRIPDRGQHGLDALYRLYPCKSGWIFLAAPQEAEWRRLAHALGRPEWLADERFVSRAKRLCYDAELIALLSLIFRTRAASEWEEELCAASVAAVRADEQPFDRFLLRNGHLMAMEHPSFGQYWRLPLAVDFPDMSGRVAPPTAAGEHTRPLLAEVGYSPTEWRICSASGWWPRPSCPHPGLRATPLPQGKRGRRTNPPLPLRERGPGGEGRHVAGTYTPSRCYSMARASQ